MQKGLLVTNTPMALASNIPEDDEWFQRYRAARDARAGRGYINGVPSEQALAGVERSPILPAPGIPAVTPQQADRAMVTAEQIGADRFYEQQTEKNDRRDRYNTWLAEQGINPNRIGAGVLEGDMGDRTLRTPSLEQQQAAVGAKDARNASDARARIAARRMYRQDPAAWAAITNQLSEQKRARGTNNASQLSDYWQNRIFGAYPFRMDYFNSSNGFGY